VESIRLASPRTMTGDGEGLVSRGGLVWLAETADLCGLTAGLDNAFAGVPARVHRPRRTIAHVVLGLADGATELSDLAALRGESSVAGRVASVSTLWRTCNQVGPVELRGIARARATARERAWAAGADPMVRCW
jgi:hypothetical protein